MKECWKQVEALIGYEVSNFGELRNSAGRILKGSLDKDGYRVFRFPRKIGQKRYRLSRLVAEAFIGPCSLQVNHKDGTKKNNRVDNLEYATDKENKEHSSRLGLIAHGERHGQSKLKEVDVLEIRKLYKEGLTQNSIAEMFGVTQWTIGSILVRKTWRHIL